MASVFKTIRNSWFFQKVISFFRFITTPFRWVFNKIADIYHRFRPISDTTIYPYTLASSEIQKKFSSFVTPEFATKITSTYQKGKDTIKLSDEQKQLIREYPFTFVAHVNKMSVISGNKMPNFFERKKQKSKN